MYCGGVGPVALLILLLFYGYLCRYVRIAISPLSFPFKYCVRSLDSKCALFVVVAVVSFNTIQYKDECQQKYPDYVYHHSFFYFQEWKCRKSLSVVCAFRRFCKKEEKKRNALVTREILNVPL